MKKKVIIFLDVIAHKNKMQLDLLHEMDMEPVCFVSYKHPSSNKYFKNQSDHIALENGFLKRVKQIFLYFKKNKYSIHHLEVYPGGRFSFIYIFLAKLFFLKTICGERGDILYYHKKGYNALVRFSMYCCYRFANIVWYREPYMRSKLEAIRGNGLFFLHNAIYIPDIYIDNNINKKYDFLWLNRVIPERKSKWFLNTLQTLPFSKTKNILVGIQEGTAFNAEVNYVVDNCPFNLELVPYTTEPVHYFKSSKFFVLPADVVFANHALLEAMSFGVVPLISNRPGSELIVENNKSGIIFEHSAGGFENAMLKAINLSNDEYLQYANECRNKIKDQFSKDKYAERLKELYTLVE